MCKQTVVGIAAALVFLCAITAQAELYQYTDQNGVVHYTDNYPAIPEQYRPQVDAQEETPPEPQKTEPQKAQSENPASQPEDPGQKDPGGLDKTAGDDATRHKGAALAERKKKLDQTYEALMEEKKALDAQAGELTGKDEIRAYNEKVAQLNEKIKQYQEKRQALKTEIEAFNKGVKGE